MSAEERAAWLWSKNPRTEEARLAALLLRWRVDPVACAVEAFRTTLQRYQAQILLDLFDSPIEVYEQYGLDPTHPRRQVVVPSGHGLGKTRVLALAIWIKLITSRFSRVLVTAPTSDQITGQLWGEVRKLRRRLERAFPDIAEEWEVQSAAINHRNPEFGDWCAQARTARAEKPEGLQGAHALDADDEFGDIAALFGDDFDSAPSGGILVIVEEASGVVDEIRDVLSGALSEEGAQFLAVGNPTRNDGWFARDSQNRERYAVHPLDCRMSNRDVIYELPYRDFKGRVTQLRVRGFVRPSYWHEMLAECGGDEEHDRFRVRVRGLVPRSNNEQVLSTHWLDAAMKRLPDPESTAHAVSVVGIDFGLTGDKHGLAVRKGFAALHLDEWLPPNHPDDITMEAARRVIDSVDTFRARTIVGDANGVGRGAMEYLANYYHVQHRELGVRVILFNAGQRASSPRYYRRRDQMWYRDGRRWFSDHRCSLPPNERLKKQACAPTAHEDATKRIAVETKDEVWKRTKEPSGNLMDALLQTLVVNTDIEAEERAQEEKLPKVLEEHFKRWNNRHAESEAIR